MSNSGTIPYARFAPGPVDRTRVLKLGLFALAAAFLANAVPAYFILSMLKIPAGSAIRPMIESAMITLGVLGGLGAGLPLAINCLMAGRRWWVGWVVAILAIILSCSPWFVSDVLWDWVVARQSFSMKP